MILAKIFGIVGLIFIILGVVTRRRKKQDIFYIFGGLFLLIYSISLRDVIFIVLQSVFTIVAIYDFRKKSKN